MHDELSQLNELPLMTIDDLDAVERAICKRLPAAYRNAMTSYSSLFPNTEWIDDLPNDRDFIIEMNGGPQHARQHFPGVSKQESLPGKTLFQIGSDGGEKSYWLNCDEDYGPVYVNQLERGTLRPEYPSLPAFIAFIAKEYADIEAEKRIPMKALKSWWQFWK